MDNKSKIQSYEFYMGIYQELIDEAKSEEDVKRNKQRLNEVKAKLVETLKAEIAEMELDVEWAQSEVKKTEEKLRGLEERSQRYLVGRLGDAKKALIATPEEWDPFRKMWEFCLKRHPSLTLELILPQYLSKLAVERIEHEVDGSDPLKNSLKLSKLTIMTRKGLDPHWYDLYMCGDLY